MNCGAYTKPTKAAMEAMVARVNCILRSVVVEVVGIFETLAGNIKVEDRRCQSIYKKRRI